MDEVPGPQEVGEQNETADDRSCNEIRTQVDTVLLSFFNEVPEVQFGEKERITLMSDAALGFHNALRDIHPRQRKSMLCKEPKEWASIMFGSTTSSYHTLWKMLHGDAAISASAKGFLLEVKRSLAFLSRYRFVHPDGLVEGPGEIPLAQRFLQDMAERGACFSLRAKLPQDWDEWYSGKQNVAIILNYASIWFTKFNDDSVLSGLSEKRRFLHNHLPQDEKEKAPLDGFVKMEPHCSTGGDGESERVLECGASFDSFLQCQDNMDLLRLESVMAYRKLLEALLVSFYKIKAVSSDITEGAKQDPTPSESTEPNLKRARIDEGPEETLREAAEAGRVEGMKEILMSHSTVNVNGKGEDGMTLLHLACENGHDAIVAILLAHPDIDVNQKDDTGMAAFVHTCSSRKTSCVRLLLKDSRVKLNEPMNEGQIPLWAAAFCGRLELIKWWIASGREMDLGEPGNEQTDAIGVAKRDQEKIDRESDEDFEERKRQFPEIVTLLERFRGNPEQTRSEVRKGLGITGG